jgi:hypothetical protein
MVVFATSGFDESEVLLMTGDGRWLRGGKSNGSAEKSNTID